MKSYFTHLQCTWCHKEHPHERPIRTCPDCGRVLYARYDLAGLG